MFYATSVYKDEQATQCNQFGGDIGVNDLHRFNTKKERDIFVQERDYAESITRSDAEKPYKEQFNYWSKL